ncbi:UNKNOWN [Stylonychia lemnae]|uniref:Uncharacterized protein n=1 Tax=Stylonychia lemnae TaxID=5949 RepID=A0A077ZTS6_STYLE|nr:UNKNOWN [Stylonychia lemnae]|eukprot:CDW72725.1 UNKNOWN [Stylonychia lemnae]
MNYKQQYQGEQFLSPLRISFKPDLNSETKNFKEWLSPSIFLNNEIQSETNQVFGDQCHYTQLTHANQSSASKSIQKDRFNEQQEFDNLQSISSQYFKSPQRFLRIEQSFENVTSFNSRLKDVKNIGNYDTKKKLYLSPSEELFLKEQFIGDYQSSINQQQNTNEECLIPIDDIGQQYESIKQNNKSLSMDRNEELKNIGLISNNNNKAKKSTNHQKISQDFEIFKKDLRDTLGLK